MTATPDTKLTPCSSARITARHATSHAGPTAAAISAHRQDRSPQRIGLVFLEAQPEQEQVYRCTGFTDATTKIWASIR